MIVLFVKMSWIFDFLLVVNIQKVISQNLDGVSTKHLQCLLGLDRSSDCPINGEWSQWKAWEKCAGECGQMGHHTRQRLCNNPPPSHGGLKCQGSNTDTESCVLPGCTEDQYWKMIQGDPLRVSQFDVLRAMHSKFTGLSEICLMKECQYNKLENIIQDKVKAMQYWNALHCVKYAVGCPVGGGWTLWGSWSPCTAICGLGSKFRQRNCTNPPPSSPKLACQGDIYQSMSCSGISCAPRLDGVWSSWSIWSKCSVPCGSGFRTRVRQCLKKPQKRENYEINEMKSEDSSMECRKIRDLDITNMCSGPNKEVEPCHEHDCAVDGQWSGWESWLLCSAECGIGSQSRSRSCSAPPPQGSGQMCPGLVTEVRHCFERPCTVKRHHVAVLAGEGSLLYSAAGRPSRLLHMYIRFRPQNAFGTLIYRYSDECMGHSCDYASLTLEGGFLVLTALVSGCSVTTISGSKVNNDEWHEVMFTVTGVEATLHVDNAPEQFTSKFKCQPVQPNLDHSMRVGERFRGQIEQITVDYTPISLRKLNVKGSKAHEAGIAPYGTSGVQYNVGDNEEGYVKLIGKEMIRAPCPANPNQWQVELAVKPEKLSATLLYIQGDTTGDHILVTLDSGRVKMRYKYGANQSIAESPVEIVPGRWLSLYVNKEAAESDIGMSVNGETRMVLPLIVISNVSQLPMTCEGNIMIGDVTTDVEKLLKSQYSGIIVESLTGTLGFLAVDGVAEDIESLAMEEQRGVKFSSRTASISEKYEEVVMLLGQQLSLSCLYDAESSKRKSRKAVWLRLDIPVKVEVEHNPESASYDVKDDGHLTHITSSSYSTRHAVEGFYLCWVHHSSGGQGKVLLAYGVTVVDPSIEFVTVSVEAVESVAIVSFILLVIYFAVMLLHVATSTNEKFGLYRSIIRRFKGEEITEEDKIKAMLDIIRSPQSLQILGSTEALVKSEEKLLRTMRLKGGEDGFSLSESPIHPSLSDADLPLIPRHRKRQTVATDKPANNSLFPKTKQSKSILKMHTDNGRFIDEYLDSLKPLIKHKEPSSHYKHSNELISTEDLSKKKVVKEFVKTDESKRNNAISEHKYDIIYDKVMSKKQNSENKPTKSVWNSGHSDLIMESKNSLKNSFEKYGDLKNMLEFEQDRLQEPIDYDLLTLLPQPKMLPREQRNLKEINDRIKIVQVSSIKQKESPTKKVQKLFDDTKEKSTNTKATPKEEEGRKLADSSVNEVINFNCTPVKCKSPSIGVTNYERQSTPVMTKSLTRRPLQREAIKSGKRTNDLLPLPGVKNSESLPNDKSKKKKNKTKLRTQKKEDKSRSTTVKTLSICKSFGDSTESTRSIPTFAKMSEHHLILDESLHDIL